jgi:hypothetical protein
MAALSVNQQTTVWFAIFVVVALVLFGWLYYSESAEREVDTTGKMYRGDPPPPQVDRRDADLAKPANPPLEAGQR